MLRKSPLCLMSRSWKMVTSQQVSPPLERQRADTEEEPNVLGQKSPQENPCVLPVGGDKERGPSMKDTGRSAEGN